MHEQIKKTKKNKNIAIKKMYIQKENIKKKKGISANNERSQIRNSNNFIFHFFDNHPLYNVQRKISDPVDNRFKLEHINQLKKSTDSSLKEKPIQQKNNLKDPIQRVVYANMNAMWAAVHPGYALANIRGDSVLSKLYNDAAAQLPNVNFNLQPGTAPQITSTPGLPQPFRLDYDTAANLGINNHVFAGKILHELVHAASAQMYTNNLGGAPLPPGSLDVFINFNLPAPVGIPNALTGFTPNQTVARNNQETTVQNNYQDLETIALADRNAGNITMAQYNFVHQRIVYGSVTAFAHYDTVVGEIMYYLRANGLRRTRTYKFARRMLKEANSRRRNDIWSSQGTEVRRVDRNKRWFQFWKW